MLEGGQLWATMAGRIAAVIGSSAACTACISIAPDDQTSGWHLGLVRFEQASSRDGVTTTASTTLGGWADQEAGVGWRSTRTVAVPPGCRLVVLTRTAADFAALGRVLNDIEGGERLCGGSVEH